MLNLAPFLAYVAVTTFTPGPNNLLSMSNGLRSGYRATLRFLLGIFCGFTLVMLLCALANVALLHLLPQVRFWLNLLGALYMLYLAFHIATAKTGAQDEGDGRSLNTFRAGFGLQFLNLKVILYGVTVFSLFITGAFSSPLAVALFAPLLAAVSFVSCSLWALSGNLFRAFLGRYERWFNLAMAALLVYTALAAFWGGH